jgi:hypothetical protein
MSFHYGRVRSKQLEKARLANIVMQRAAEAKKAAQRQALRPGDPGWRMHASIPQVNIIFPEMENAYDRTH